MDDFEILFVDDDTTILNMVEEYLVAFDYRVSIVDSGLKALELIKDKDFDLVFTDFKMPDIDGLELLAMIKEYRPATEVIIVTGHGTMESAIQAMKFGSYDYIQKPFKLDLLKVVINKLYEEKRLNRENIVLRTRVKERHKYDQLVGISLKMQAIYDQIDHMQNGSPNVLIQGESGTGKELAAHVIQKGILDLSSWCLSQNRVTNRTSLWASVRIYSGWDVGRLDINISQISNLISQRGTIQGPSVFVLRTSP